MEFICQVVGRTLFRSSVQKIAVLAFDGVVSFDLTIPCGVFVHTFLANGKSPYEVKVCGPKKIVKTDLFDFKLRHGLEEMLKADTIIVPGMTDISVKCQKKS